MVVAFLLSLFFLCCHVCCVIAVEGMDVSSVVSQETFECILSNKSFDFVIVRAYHSYGAVDTNAPITLANAKAAGIPDRNVYIFPCYGKAKTGEIPASQQVYDTVEYLAENDAEYNSFWFDIESNPSTGCAWENATANFSLNCDFLGELIKEGQILGLSMGVYGSHNTWNLFMGNCTVASYLPLWYAGWNGVESFDGWVPYGGWTAPTIKQYYDELDIDGCTISADADWYPESSGS